jgi:hypothetical protein
MLTETVLAKLPKGQLSFSGNRFSILAFKKKHEKTEKRKLIAFADLSLLFSSLTWKKSNTLLVRVRSEIVIVLFYSDLFLIFNPF